MTAAQLLEDEADDENNSREAQEVIEKPLAMVLRVCYLCSGPRREGDVEFHLAQLGLKAGLLVLVDMLDLEASPSTDLLDARVQDEIRHKARAGRWQAGIGAPPCSTWSAALFARWSAPRFRQICRGLSALFFAYQCHLLLR